MRQVWGAVVRRSLVLTWVVVCVIASVSAQAFIDPPVLVPANPQAGDAIAVSIRSGDCDGFLTTPPVVTQTGNSIHILLESLHWGDIILCNITPFTSEFPVGTFPPGTYTLQVERYYENAVPEPVFEVLANITFTVQGGTQPNTLPSTGFLTLLALAIGLVAIAALRFSRGRGRVMLGLLDFDCSKWGRNRRRAGRNGCARRRFWKLSYF